MANNNMENDEPFEDFMQFNELTARIINISEHMAELALWQRTFRREPTAAEIQQRKAWTVEKLLAMVDLLKQ
jgi:hypothetical protein